MVKTAHSVPVHHAHLSSWQSRGTPLPTTRLPGTPVENANGHILSKYHHLLFWEFVGDLFDISAAATNRRSMRLCCSLVLGF